MNSKTIDGKPVVSWHFLRRRAEARRGDIERWQRDAYVGTAVGQHDALARLRALGVERDDRLSIVKKGRWDARYFVVIDNESIEELRP